MTNNKNETYLEEFKYLIDSRNLSDKEKKEEKEALLKVREERYRRRSKNEIKAAKLLQLKLQMEDYVNESKWTSEHQLSFSDFLRRYIDILYDTRKSFASDMGVSPILISHLVNNHRELRPSFLSRLMLHSQESYREICDFSKELWPKVFYQDKLKHFMIDNRKLEKIERKEVKGKVVKVAEG